MTSSRRAWLVGGAAFVAGCRRAPFAGDPFAGDARGDETLDALLVAHATVRPETTGAGANHYPMAAEALLALGRADAIPAAWHAGVRYYAGALPRRPVAMPELGDANALGNWLDHFTVALAHEPWRAVLAQWLPQLAPGVAAAVFHGAIRTAHAARALQRRETAPRRHELAMALAYWASRWVALPVADTNDGGSLVDVLAAVPPPRPGPADVPFDEVVPLLTAAPLAPALLPPRADGDPHRDVRELVHDASVAFLEMLVQERHRIWLLHTITAPAAIDLLLPHVDAAGGALLVAHTRQAIVATFRALGAPFVPRAHLHARPPAWRELVGQAAASGSVHSVKLVEALHRCADPDDPVARSVAAQWLAWR